MEGMFFIADIVLMLMLAFAIFRGERKDPPGDLGLFSYKTEKTEMDQGDSPEKDKRNA
jgi:hypothetical protein